MYGFIDNMTTESLTTNLTGYFNLQLVICHLVFFVFFRFTIPSVVPKATLTPAPVFDNSFLVLLILHFYFHSIIITFLVFNINTSRFSNRFSMCPSQSLIYRFPYFYCVRLSFMPFLNAFGMSINVFIDIPTNGGKNVVENNNYGVPVISLQFNRNVIKGSSLCILTQENSAFLNLNNQENFPVDTSLSAKQNISIIFYDLSLWGLATQVGIVLGRMFELFPAVVHHD